MKIISTFPKVLFFKTTDLYTAYLFSEYVDHQKIIKDKKWNFHFARNYSKCL